MRGTTSSTASCRQRATSRRWAPRSRPRWAWSSTVSSWEWPRLRCSAMTTARSSASARVELLLLALTDAEERLRDLQAGAREQAGDPRGHHSVARDRQDDLVAVEQLDDLL